MSTAAMVVYADIPGFPGYQIGTDGSVWSNWQRRGLGSGRGSTFVQGETWHRLKTRADRDGYLDVRLCRDGRKHLPKIHQLILLSFVGPCPPGQQARHLDGNKSNNDLTNLCWGTSTENNADRKRHGTLPQGEKHKCAKLTASQVLEIAALPQIVNYNEVGRRYGVTGRNIAAIRKGRTWQHLTKLPRQ